eukprot:TRINITY_DN3017_c0_g1_i4.p1 TRINITY_DN3017_c0_g1~~TRINITY_DN3017_c0_g1_i4.p1  ORF type:complete len:284 (+),score=93.76 TRINITY_DN3017_c0_g1_i4:526-1377(+)
MADLQKRMDKRTTEELCKHFKAGFAADLRGTDMPSDDHRLVAHKKFLEAEIPKMREVVQAYKEVADAQRAMTAAVTAAQKKVSGACTNYFANDDCEFPARSELSEALAKQSTALEAAPALHYDLLAAAAEFELDEAEAMEEAIESLEELQRTLTVSKKKVASLSETVKKVSAGGEAPPSASGWLSSIGLSQKKDRETELREMKAELELKQTEVRAAEDFYTAAWTLAIKVEIDAFFAQKKSVGSLAKEAFAGSFARSAQESASLWSALAPAGSRGLSPKDFPW